MKRNEPRAARVRIAMLVDWWECIAAWQPPQHNLPKSKSDQHPPEPTLANHSHLGREDRGQLAVQERIRQSRINACFIGIFAILGISLALANAVPNQESSEVVALASLLIALLIPLACNRAGAVVIASVLLTILPTVALVATFLQPLPSGQSALTWTYDAGLAFAGFGALISSLTFRPWIAWCQIGVGIILPLSLLITLMPHAPSFVGLDVAGGIIPSYWSAHHQELYALYDFLFRPFLLIILLGFIGARMRRLMLSG
jgi:hypothetical protein